MRSCPMARKITIQVLTMNKAILFGKVNYRLSL